MPLYDVATFEDLGDSARYDVAIVKTIPSGVAGTRVTAEEVDRLVKKSILSPEVAELAEYIMSRFGGRPYDELSQIRAIHRALVAGLFYIPDPRGYETLRDGRKLAAKMLRYFHGQGPRPLADCDDYTIIGRGLLEFIGFLSKARVIGSKRIGVYNHIYPMARLKSGRWVGIEATIPGAQPFFAPRSTTVRAMDVPNISGLGAGDRLPPGIPRSPQATVKQLKGEISFLKWIVYGAIGVGALLTYKSLRRVQWRSA